MKFFIELGLIASKFKKLSRLRYKPYAFYSKFVTVVLHAKVIMSHKEQKSPFIETDHKEEEFHSLILYNDDVNTFDFVIETLIEVCEHDPMQAENCAWIAHYKGKCAVKKGTVNELKPCHKEMTNRMLTVEIK